MGLVFNGTEFPFGKMKNLGGMDGDINVNILKPLNY